MNQIINDISQADDEQKLLLFFVVLMALVCIFIIRRLDWTPVEPPLPKPESKPLPPKPKRKPNVEVMPLKEENRIRISDVKFTAGPQKPPHRILKVTHAKTKKMASIQLPGGVWEITPAMQAQAIRELEKIVFRDKDKNKLELELTEASILPVGVLRATMGGLSFSRNLSKLLK